MIRTSEYLEEGRATERDGPTLSALRHMLSAFTKRSLDFFAALIGLIALSPLFAIIAIFIKRDSQGPAFYWGPRIGRRGTIFRMLKFRTMYEEPSSYRGARITCKDDDRITPFGRWLRDTKLNELPQLWNVLIGDMSLVGPRPEDPAISQTWPAAIAREILGVRPGITSPASVVYHDEENMLPAGEVMHRYLHELSPDKMRLDQLYVRYQSFWLDLDVIFWTLLLLMPKIRASSPSEQFLFAGPITRLIQRYINWFLWDFLIILLSIGLMGATVRVVGPLNLDFPKAIELALAFSILYSLVGIVLGIDRIDWDKATIWEASRLWASGLVVITASLGLQYYVGGTSLRISGVILAAALLSLAGIVSIRYRGRLVVGLLSRMRLLGLSARAVRERVLIVGSGRTAEHIAWILEHPTYSQKFQVMGFIDDDLLSQGTKIYGAEVIGRRQDIQRVARDRDIGLIILADNQLAARKYQEVQELARFNPARVVVAPDIFGSLGCLEAASGEDAVGTLDDFQCQHCLARYSRNQSQRRSAANRKARHSPAMTKSRARKNREKRKNGSLLDE